MIKDLRAAIIAEMQRHEEMKRRDYPSSFYREREAVYPTWWFKHSIYVHTAQARVELEKMEKEGLVTANRSQSNNTKWLLVLPAADRVSEP